MRLFSLGLMLILVACGFHLRGNQGNNTIRYHNLYINCNSNNIEVCSLLKNTISNQNLTNLANNQADADYILEITDIHFKKDSMGLNEYGRISSYKLTYQAIIKVFNKKSVQVLDNRLVSYSQLMNYNDSLVLSAQSQEQKTWSEIYLTIVDLILHNLTIRQ